MTLRYALSVLFSLGCVAVQAQVSPFPARLAAQAVVRPIPAAQLAQPGTITPLAPALPVAAHQRLTIHLRATTPATSALADQLLRAAALAYGQSPPPPVALPEQTAVPRRRVPYLGAGVALALTPQLRPHQHVAAAYVQYRFYNADSVLVAAQRQPLTRRAHQTLTLATTLPTDGYVEVAFVNERAAPVQLTNLRIHLAEATYPGGSGDGGGTGAGGTGNSPSHPIPAVVGNPLIIPQHLNNPCDGMTAALALQNTYHREVEGFMLDDGTAILLPMQHSTEFHSIIHWPIDDSDGHRLMPAPYQDASGAWFIDISTWTNGVRNGPITHAIVS